MNPEDINPTDLVNQEIGPVTVLFGYEQGKYPYGNSLLIRGADQTAIIDPCLGVIARKDHLPEIDLVIHSHTHEDHIAGTHLFRDVPWYAHELDALGLRSLDGLMEIYGLASGEAYDSLRHTVDTTFFYPHDGVVETFVESRVFDLGGVTATIVHTPGHTRGHCCIQVEWGSSASEKLVYLGDIELTGFGPYYGDAWSDLIDFEHSIERLRHIDARWWLTFHHKGLIDGRDKFLLMLEKFADMIGDREARLLEFIGEPRSMEEIVAHRFVYRPGQTGLLIDEIERRSMMMHLQRLQQRDVVSLSEGLYQVNSV